jgi:hypothetical protein
LAQVHKAGKMGFLNRKGEEIIALEFDSAANPDFAEGLCAVRKAGQWGFINKQGTVIIPFEYIYAESFNKGIARVKTTDAWVYINKSGRHL